MNVFQGGLLIFGGLLSNIQLTPQDNRERAWWKLTVGRHKLWVGWDKFILFHEDITQLYSEVFSVQGFQE